MLGYQCLKIALGLTTYNIIFQQGTKKPPPNAGGSQFVIFQQRVIGRQIQAFQHRHRRSTQQRGKPAMKGFDLHATPLVEQGLV